MKVLVIGSGGREHALVWKLAQSPKVTGLYTAPGNAGTAQISQNLAVPANDTEGLVKAAKEKKIDLVVVGPEGPLADGIVDRFRAESIPIFGPTRAAAQLEASKVFAKDLMQRYAIPCAGSKSFTLYEEARKYVEKQGAPIVIKADGLAAGKGVTVARSVDEALSALKDAMQSKVFGKAGERVVIEEFLTGREVSALAFTDGKTIVPIVAACDYKPVFDGNRGPNTGGMGSFSPPDFYHTRLAERVRNSIMTPTIRAMNKEKTPYQGVLYCGLMINKAEPKLLEYNSRFGDPETQVILPRLKTDLVDVMLAVIESRLDKIKVEWSEDACVAVVMASGGYPGSYKTGFPITGLDKVDKDVTVFHAGTKVGTSGEILTAGGRVLNVAATGKTLAEAREKVYANIQKINFNGAHYRKDIALF
ncbi:MAG: phosphoribosylamine--glycine ligase [Chloroflexota bacterium]